MTIKTNPLSTAIWPLVLAGLLGMVSGDRDLSACRNTCSAVPEEMWPHCCETHHTCCENFADSCISNCLPGVHSGDVSAMEERPALCCALYNLCCFRETLKLSFARNDAASEPQDIPFTHRFSTLPGGPMKSRQTSVAAPKITQDTAHSVTSFTKTQVHNDNAARNSPKRPKPKRNFQSSFRDTTRTNDRETETNSNIQKAENTASSQLDGRNPSAYLPSASVNDRPQAREEDTRPFSRPKISTQPSKLRRLNSPSKLTSSFDSKDAVFPDITKPTEASTSVKTPKVLEQPKPTEQVRPGSVFRPLSPRKPIEPSEPEVDVKEETKEPQKVGRPSLRTLQPKTPALSKSDAEPERSESKPGQNKPANKVRPRLLIRPGVNRDKPNAGRQVTEAPVPVTTTEAQSRRESKLLRPKVTAFRPGKRLSATDEGSSKTENLLDQEVSDTTLSQQTANQGQAVDLNKNSESKIKEETSSPEGTEKESVSPIRKIKLIRTRGPNKPAVSQRPHESNKNSEVSEPSQTTTEKTTVAPPARIQVSRGRPRITQKAQEVTTFRPRTTPIKTLTSTQATRVRSRGQSRSTLERSDSTTTGRTRESSRSQSKQEPARQRGSSTRGRSRSRSRATTQPTTTTVKPHVTNQEDTLKHVPVKIPITTTEKASIPEVIETTTETVITEAETTMKTTKDMVEKTAEAKETQPDDAAEVETDVAAEIASDPKEEQRSNLKAIKKSPLLKPRPQSEERKEEESKPINKPEEVKAELPLTVEKVSIQPTTLRKIPGQQPSPTPSAQPQVSRQSQQPSKVRPQTQEATTYRPTTLIASRQRTTTQAASRQSSSTRAANTQRSSTRSDTSSRQTTSRSRGRLTARQRIALANAENPL